MDIAQLIVVILFTVFSCAGLSYVLISFQNIPRLVALFIFGIPAVFIALLIISLWSKLKKDKDVGDTLQSIATVGQREWMELNKNSPPGIKTVPNGTKGITSTSHQGCIVNPETILWIIFVIVILTKIFKLW